MVFIYVSDLISSICKVRIREKPIWNILFNLTKSTTNLINVCMYEMMDVLLDLCMYNIRIALREWNYVLSSIYVTHL